MREENQEDKEETFPLATMVSTVGRVSTHERLLEMGVSTGLLGLSRTVPEEYMRLCQGH